jgi:LmbE family N-acetylglucosaminyl deacetylase
MHMLRFVALAATLIVLCSCAAELEPPRDDAAQVTPLTPVANQAPDPRTAIDTVATPAGSESLDPFETARRPVRLLNFVAHQDDDFFLMSPDLFNVVRGGRATVASVMFTAGENLAESCSEYVTAREQGQMRAWEVMAGLESPQAWDESLIEPAGKPVRVLTMRARPELKLYYLGLPNRAERDLELLWNARDNETTISTSPHQSCEASYTRNQLIETILAIVRDFRPTDVNTMDSGKTWPLFYPFDHSDHVHSALFTLAALQRYEVPLASVRMYRAYNAANEVRNVSQRDYLRKLSLYHAYAPYDLFLCEGTVATICQQLIVCNNPSNIVYDVFNLVQYPILVRKNLEGAIRGPGKLCLRADGSAAGSSVSLGACTSTGKPLDEWALPEDGTLRHVASSLCLRSAEGEPRGAAITLAACDARDPRQRFMLTGIGQLRGPDATCVDGSLPSALKLAECAREAALLDYEILFYPEPFDANASDFDAWDVLGTPGQAGSLTYGDIDGDLDDDVCVRRASGVRCAFNDGGARFHRVATFSNLFSDREGFGSDASGSTLQLGNVDGDPGADLCARKSDGLYCATWSAASRQFGPVQKRSRDADFSDALGYHLSSASYGSVHLVDLDKDGKADVCGRNSAGIECALNDGRGQFGPALQWTIEEFSDAGLWWNETAGSTLQFADLNGDGFSDVCGRGTSGMICMLNAGAGKHHFEEAHHWSDTGDFSDLEGWADSAARYGSVRLGDINGDGRADVCGRSKSGVVCGLSMGEAFEAARPILANDPFHDEAGYDEVAYGASLAIVRLDGDDHRDVCLRGPLASGGIGLRCALAP